MFVAVVFETCERLVMEERDVTIDSFTEVKIGFGAASQYGTLVGVVCAEAEGFVFVAKGSDFGVVSGVGTACGTVVIGTTWVWHL